MSKCIQCGNSVSGKGQLFCSKRCRYKYHHSGDMVLTLKKKWFDMILSGEKTEEYRVIKPYWTKRFENYFGRNYDFSEGGHKPIWDSQKRVVIFRNGYGADKPAFNAECTISEGTGKENWGAERDTVYYVLKIHRILGGRNIA